VKEITLKQIPDQMEQLPSLAHKRLFIGLTCGISLLFSLILVLVWGIPYIGFKNIHPSVPYLTGSILILILAVVGWTTFALIFQITAGIKLWGADRARGLSVKLFLPLMELVGRLVGVRAAETRRSFIQVNNELVHGADRQYIPEEILILLPHCIQWSACTFRVSNRLARCKRCGNCNIGPLLDLTEKYGVSIAVATGGTIARRIVVEKKPRLIIAVACERDLASGIQDTYPLPVYGILNERPHGPCIDTLVSITLVEKTLRSFIHPENLPEVQ
jgi:hypothetical protein